MARAEAEHGAQASKKPDELGWAKLDTTAPRADVEQRQSFGAWRPLSAARSANFAPRQGAKEGLALRPLALPEPMLARPDRLPHGDWSYEVKFRWLPGDRGDRVGELESCRSTSSGA
jgi:hypothetical protein